MSNTVTSLSSYKTKNPLSNYEFKISKYNLKEDVKPFQEFKSDY
jgi:hypothetical protein